MNDDEPTNLPHPLITPDHLRRLAIVYCRQSTEKQVDQNTGSTAYQRSLAGVVREYGWQDSQIITIDEDLGRSGSTIQGRTGWERLQEMIDANQVGAVFVANISRLARQVYDFEVFRMRAALHHTLLYSDGRLTDPANSNDAIVSQMMAMVASFENRKRAEVMMQSRLAKAKRGEAVSRLPVGWIKGPDGKYDFDPQTKDTIRMIIDTFWQTRSVRQTVKTLVKAGIQIPCRKRGQRIYFSKPTIGRVTFILTHPAYAGVYTYGKSQSERERLLHEEAVAQERAELARGRLPSVYFDALEKLDKVLLEKKEFEQKIALEPVAPSHEESEEELRELCRLASEVPSLWQHEEMTHQERKEILRCLIDHIVVSVTEEKIDASIVWKTGDQTPFSLWSVCGRHNLIRELHSQRL